MQQLPVIDLVIIIIYVGALIITGFYFAFRGENSSRFVSAGGGLPAWAVGLSIFGTYLSSNTYIGVTGKAYGENWNAFVFSLSLPVAAWISSKYFVPFYRKTGLISAYAHIETRFGVWARVYMDVCYLFTQLARMGSIMFGVSLVLSALTGINISYIILLMGILVTIYTLLGGIEAVIWTDVMQSIVLTIGAILILIFLCIDVEGGFYGIIHQGIQAKKFSLGEYNLNLGESTFWVVLLYGIFINLNNFGIDQSFIQRYHTADSEKSASQSVWMAAKLYIPVSLLFFFIGTGLWVYYNNNPDKLIPIKDQFMQEIVVNQANDSNYGHNSKVKDSDIGDRILPDYMIHRLPQGVTGILIAALFAAAMSSVDSSLNSSATIFWTDIYKRFINSNPSEKVSMRVLQFSTIIWGISGTVVALALIGVKSILDAWWQLSGIFAGGMLGLFLLGLVSRRTNNIVAKISVVIGILIITWMTFPMVIPSHLAFLRSPFHANMIVVIGTLSIFLSGIVIPKIFGLKKPIKVN
jgi:SSS family solute:Na+ symporter